MLVSIFDILETLLHEQQETLDVDTTQHFKVVNRDDQSKVKRIRTRSSDKNEALSPLSPVKSQMPGKNTIENISANDVLVTKWRYKTVNIEDMDEEDIKNKISELEEELLQYKKHLNKFKKAEMSFTSFYY